MDTATFPETRAAFHADPLSLLWKKPGIWPINKPSGPSSNLIVVRSRKALATKKVGHAGTLDPMASGLLLLLVGNATRLFDLLQDFPKSYRAGFTLGARTDSQDATGNPLAGFAPHRTPPIERDEMVAALSSFRGEIMQTPPMHSALKKDGQPLYKLARKGETVERTARPVSVYTLELSAFDGIRGELEMRVSKGFYVRTLIDDIGLALGTGGVMTSLVRTAVGPFNLDSAISIDDIGEKTGEMRLS